MVVVVTVAAAVGGVVVVVTLPGPGPGPGPGSAPAGASYADPSEIFRLSEPALPFLAFPLLVPRLRKFGPKAVRRQAPFVAVAAVAAAGTSARSPGPRAPGLPAVGARAVRHWHDVTGRRL